MVYLGVEALPCHVLNAVKTFDIHSQLYRHVHNFLVSDSSNGESEIYCQIITSFPVHTLNDRKPPRTPCIHEHKTPPSTLVIRQHLAKHHVPSLYIALRYTKLDLLFRKHTPFPPNFAEAFASLQHTASQSSSRAPSKHSAHKTRGRLL